MTSLGPSASIAPHGPRHVDDLGSGAVLAGDPIDPIDREAAFAAHARGLAVHLGKRWMLGMMGFALVWWPTDPFVFAGQPRAQLVFAWLRGLAAALHLAWWAGLRYSARVQRHALVVLAVYGAVVIMLPGRALAELGPPSAGWFGYLYLALLPAVFFPLPLGRRLVATFMPALTLALSYFGSHPEYLADPAAASSLSYLVFAGLLVTGLGAFLHGVVRRSFFQALALAHAQRSLEVLNALLDQRLSAQEQVLQQLAEDATRAADRERERLAHELHDALGQELTAARMALGIARARAFTDARHLTGNLAELERLLARTASTARELVHRLRPRVLETAGLGGALEALASEIRAHGDLDVTLELPPPSTLDALADGVATAVYRFAQEALTNVLRHADARRVVVAVRVDHGLVEAEVSDDGRGIGAPPDDAGRGRHGLNGMRARALALGGSVTHEAAERDHDRPGTRAILRVPRLAEATP